MARRYLYLLIEESFRELRSRLLITQAALEAEFEIVVGQQWWFVANFHALPTGIVLVKGNNTIQAAVMKTARTFGHKVASIEEEAFGLKDVEIFHSLLDPRVENLCQLFLMHGDYQADLLKQRFPSASGRISVVGNPRVDVLRNIRWSTPTGAAGAFALRHGKFVLINTNYAAINPYDYDTLTYFTRCVGVGVLDPENPVHMNLFHTQCVWERRNLGEMMAFIREMARRAPAVQIVLRPHPSENPETWRRAMVGHASVHVVIDEDHVPWTLACSSLVHSSSTTGLEAFLLSRPAVDLCAGVSAWHDRYIAPIVNTVVGNAQAAADAVEEHLCETLFDEDEKRGLAALGKHLLTETDRTSAQAIVEALDELASTEASEALDPTVLTNPESSKRQRFKAFVSRDVIERMRHENARDGEIVDATVDDLGPSVWWIKRREVVR